MHEYILAGWGVPIGEMWDLEALAKKCEERKRWIFFMTSAPANVQSESFALISVSKKRTNLRDFVAGVGSHANALAIF
jgi:hypothetical protein